MTTQEIKDELSKEIGYNSLEDYINELINSGSFYTKERIIKYIDELSIRVQQEQQKLIAENACIEPMGMMTRVDKSSIINENNIIR